MSNIDVPAATPGSEAVPSRHATAAALVTAAIALAAYVASNDPHVATFDWGQFQTMAATGGIAHAGYPGLVLLLRVFGWLPLGTLAFRANLLSGVAAAFAVGAASWAIARRTGRVGPAVAAGLALAFAHVVWREAVHAGVHALTLAIDAAVFVLATRFAARPSRGGALAVGLAFGYGLTCHLTVLGLVPVLLWALVRAGRSRTLRAAHVGLAVLGLALGLLPFGYMLAQDRPDRPMNYIEDVMRLEPGEYFARAADIPHGRLARAAWLLSGRQYLAEPTQRPLGTIAPRLKFLAATLVLNDLPGVALVLGLAGLVWMWRRGHRDGPPLLLWLAGALVMTVVGAVFPVVPIFFMPGLWVLCQGLGESLAAVEARHRGVFALLAALLVVTPIARTGSAAPPGPLARIPIARTAWKEFPVPWSPFRRDPSWDDYGRGVLATIPPRTMLLTLWDQCTVLRYFTLGLGVRHDVEVLPVGTDGRVTHALQRAEARRTPAYATYVPDAAGLAGWRAVPVRMWPAGGLWRLERSDAGGHPMPRTR